MLIRSAYDGSYVEVAGLLLPLWLPLSRFFCWVPRLSLDVGPWTVVPYVGPLASLSSVAKTSWEVLDFKLAIGGLNCWKSGWTMLVSSLEPGFYLDRRGLNLVETKLSVSIPVLLPLLLVGFSKESSRAQKRLFFGTSYMPYSADIFYSFWTLSGFSGFSLLLKLSCIAPIIIKFFSVQSVWLGIFFELELFLNANIFCVEGKLTMLIPFLSNLGLDFLAAVGEGSNS